MALYFIPIIVGICIIVQSGLNDKIESSHNLFYALLYGNVVFILLSILAFSIFNNPKSVGFSFWSKQHLGSLSWWFLLPGIMGITIVAGSAIGFDKLGASKTVSLIVASQLVVSLLWDYFVKSKEISVENVIGITLVITGALFSLKILKIPN